jgi:hypothetical protein
VPYVSFVYVLDTFFDFIRESLYHFLLPSLDLVLLVFFPSVKIGLAMIHQPAEPFATLVLLLEWILPQDDQTISGTLPPPAKYPDFFTSNNAFVR